MFSERMRSRAWRPMALAVALFFAAPGSAAEKLYPPYPDIWEREVPIPDWVWDRADRSDVDVIETDEGDIRYGFEVQGENLVFDFFSGQMEKGVSFRQRPADRAKKNIAEYGSIDFKNGHRLLFSDNHDEEDCYGGFYAGLSYHVPNATSSTGSEILWWKQILAYLDRPRRPPFTESCPRQKQEYANFEEYVFAVAFQNMVQLKDGTLLAFAPDFKTIFRVRLELTSPAFDKRGFMAFDWEEVWAMKKPYQGPDIDIYHHHVRAALDRLRATKPRAE